MKSQEQQAVDFLLEFLDVWIKRIYPDNLTDRVSAFIHPDCNGIGTASHEIWRGKEEVMAQIAKEIAQLPDPNDYEMRWIKGSEFGKDVVL